MPWAARGSLKNGPACRSHCAGAAARHALVWPWRITTMLKFAVLVAVAAAETNSSALLLDKSVCAYDRIRVNWTLTKPPSDPHIALYETTPVIGNEAPRPRAKIPITLPPLPPVDADLPRELHDLSGGVAVEPLLTAMRWNADNWIMTLEFEKPTNAPPIADVRAFDRMLSTNIDLRALTASW